MVRITAPITPAWAAANARAIANLKAGRRPQLVSPGIYRIASAHGDQTYLVTIVNVGRLDATCDCVHGQGAKAGHCWHKSAALMAEIDRVSRPAAPAQPVDAGTQARRDRFSKAFGATWN